MSDQVDSGSNESISSETVSKDNEVQIENSTLNGKSVKIIEILKEDDPLVRKHTYAVCNVYSRSL